MADMTARDTIQRVVCAIRADATQEPDSPLLVAMGYVTRSTRKAEVPTNVEPLKAAA